MFLPCATAVLLSIGCGTVQTDNYNSNANKAVANVANANSTAQGSVTGNVQTATPIPTPMGEFPSSHDLETALKTRLKTEDPTVLDDSDTPAANRATWSGKVWLDLNLGDFCRQNSDIARHIVVDATTNALQPFNLRLRDDAKRRLGDVTASMKCSDALRMMASVKYETQPIYRRP